MSITSNNSTNSTTTKNVSAQVDKATSNIANEFNNFVADVEDLIKATTHLTGEDLTKAKAKLSERIAIAKESASEIGESLANRARKTAETTNTYVHEQPWNAVGVGAAFGLVVGYLLARRN